MGAGTVGGTTTVGGSSTSGSGTATGSGGNGLSASSTGMSSLGALSGQRFAAELADLTGARVAGHTYVIGFFQSGLRCLSPGARPHWSVWEGLGSGSPQAPLRALASRPGAPSTITCLTARLPQTC